VLSVDESRRLVELVLALPHGVISMSRDLPGLVETSTNVARVRFEESDATVLNSTRSSVGPALERVRTSIRSIASLAGARYAGKDAYPGWQPNMNSNLLRMTTRVLGEFSGKTPEVTAIHAGLECGIIGEKYPGMDMISVGPTMKDVHSPDERLSISSTQRFYEFMKKLMAELD
jgi:dipeptidase D